MAIHGFLGVSWCGICLKEKDNGTWNFYRSPCDLLVLYLRFFKKLGFLKICACCWMLMQQIFESVARIEAAYFDTDRGSQIKITNSYDEESFYCK